MWKTHFDPHGIEIRHGAFLPHWTREGAIYSVSFRLGNVQSCGQFVGI